MKNIDWYETYIDLVEQQFIGKEFIEICSETYSMIGNGAGKYEVISERYDEINFDVMYKIKKNF